MQLRFRVIKSLIQYHDIWDYIAFITSCVIWIGSALVFGIIYPPWTDYQVNPALQIYATAAWAMYALIMDNCISFIFIYQLFKTRHNITDFNVSPKHQEKIKKLRVIIYYSLGLSCTATWSCLGLTFAAVTLFQKDPSNRRLFYRIAYAFSTLHFSGAAIFMYSVRTLFTQPSRISYDSSYSNSPITVVNLKSSHKGYISSEQSHEK